MDGLRKSPSARILQMCSLLQYQDWFKLAHIICSNKKDIMKYGFEPNIAQLIQTDIASGSVVFTSNNFNAKQDGKIFAFLIRVIQPWNYDILSDKAGFNKKLFRCDTRLKRALLSSTS